MKFPGVDLSVVPTVIDSIPGIDPQVIARFQTYADLIQYLEKELGKPWGELTAELSQAEATVDSVAKGQLATPTTEPLAKTLEEIGNPTVLAGHSDETKALIERAKAELATYANLLATVKANAETIANKVRPTLDNTANVIASVNALAGLSAEEFPSAAEKLVADDSPFNQTLKAMVGLHQSNVRPDLEEFEKNVTSALGAYNILVASLKSILDVGVEHPELEQQIEQLVADHRTFHDDLERFVVAAASAYSAFELMVAFGVPPHIAAVLAVIMFLLNLFANNGGGGGGGQGNGPSDGQGTGHQQSDQKGSESGGTRTEDDAKGEDAKRESDDQVRQGPPPGTKIDVPGEAADAIPGSGGDDFVMQPFRHGQTGEYCLAIKHRDGRETTLRFDPAAFEGFGRFGKALEAKTLTLSDGNEIRIPEEVMLNFVIDGKQTTVVWTKTDSETLAQVAPRILADD